MMGFHSFLAFHDLDSFQEYWLSMFIKCPSNWDLFDVFILIRQSLFFFFLEGTPQRLSALLITFYQGYLIPT